MIRAVQNQSGMLCRVVCSVSGKVEGEGLRSCSLEAEPEFLCE